MFWISLLLNCLIFVILINLIRWAKFRQRPDSGSFRPSILFPVALGLLLTLLDSMRLVFIQQLAVFLVLAVLMYKIFSVFQRK